MASPGLSKVAADGGCFVCGAANPLGLKAPFATDIERRCSFARLQLAADYQGWQEVIHGGIVAAVLDEACIYASRALAEQCVTAELQVRYRKPVPVGAWVEVTGRLVDHRRKLWLARAELRIDGVLHAEAEAKVFVLPPTAEDR